MSDFNIRGFVDVSFVDWDGKIASVIFLPRCNFNCPMCHNGGLLHDPDLFERVPIEQVIDYLEEKRDFIDGVVVTGGEPTIYPDLIPLCEEIKKHGFQIKLDTNGYRPDVLETLFNKKLIDYVAMDVKSALREDIYSLSAGVPVDVGLVKQSIVMLMKSSVDYEFRTTVVPTVNNPTDIAGIAQHLTGCKRYFLQYYRPDNAQCLAYRDIKPATQLEMEKLLAIARNYIPHAKIRGKSFAGD